jgi:phosphohistidine phosphatase
MLTLSLLRHAKSSWDDPRLDDHERPLAKRGVKDAPRVGAYMAEHDLRPDLVLCSGALRTRATLALVLAEWGGAAPETQYDDELYLAPPSVLLASLQAVEEDAPHILMIGHNPGMHALALELTGSGDRKLIAGLAKGFPTSALAVLSFELKDWSQLRAASGRLRHLVTPRTSD